MQGPGVGPDVGQKDPRFKVQLPTHPLMAPGQVGTPRSLRGSKYKMGSHPVRCEWHLAETRPWGSLPCPCPASRSSLQRPLSLFTVGSRKPACGWASVPVEASALSPALVDSVPGPFISSSALGMSVSCVSTRKRTHGLTGGMGAQGPRTPGKT